MNTKEHLKTIEKAREYLNKEDYESLLLYLDLREAEVRKAIEENKASDYIDKLVSKLK